MERRNNLNLLLELMMLAFFIKYGVDYSVPNKKTTLRPVSEDIASSPHNHQNQAYFTEPMYGPVHYLNLLASQQPSSL
jgi:hypothetical protein